MTFTAPEGLVRAFLAWLAERPRSYGETMDAWRTSCPRMAVWEDAIDHRLIGVTDTGTGLQSQAVELTAEGRAWLDAHR